MADRKVLVKYYPPDFDPEKLAQKGRLYRNYEAKRRRGSVKLMNVRFMFPFTMCCAMCNEFIYIGTKFNSRVEKIRGEEYLGIAIWRFYGRCPHCRAEITFKTDPQNTEYVLESGGTRTYDPRKDADLAEMTLKEQLQEEMTDSIRALEHKTHSTANELIVLEQLDELRKINKRLLNRETAVDEALCWLKKGGLEKEEKIKELDSDDLADLAKAKEEMNERQLTQSIQSSSSDDDDIKDIHINEIHSLDAIHSKLQVPHEPIILCNHNDKTNESLSEDACNIIGQDEKKRIISIKANNVTTLCGTAKKAVEKINVQIINPPCILDGYNSSDNERK